MNIQKPKSRQPIPENAKLVHKGIVFDVYQWEQEMFDGNIKTFEKITRADTVDVIAFTEDNKVIVLEQEQPGVEKFFSLPGGRVDEGEDIVECMKREFVEETGFECGEADLWHSGQFTSKIDWAFYFFVAKNCKKVGEQNLDSGEKIQVRLFEFDEFIELIFSGKIRGYEKIIIKLIQEGIFFQEAKSKLEDIKKIFIK